MVRMDSITSLPQEVSHIATANNTSAEESVLGFKSPTSLFSSRALLPSYFQTTKSPPSNVEKDLMQQKPGSSINGQHFFADAHGIDNDGIDDVEETREEPPTNKNDIYNSNTMYSSLLDHDRTPDNDNDEEEGGEQELLCDYHINPTRLYKLLEDSKWGESIERMRTHPIEAQTWIVRKDKNRHDRVLWKLLPLHAAVVFQSPPSVIITLLETYPMAAAKVDDQGMIPLHLAFRLPKKNEAFLELLLAQYPDGIHIKDKKYRIPIELGRDNLFSSNLMHTYADAQTLVNRRQVERQTAETSSMSSYYRQQVHEEELNKLKSEFDVEKMQMKSDYSKIIEQLKVNFHRQIKAVKEESELRLEEARAEASFQANNIASETANKNFEAEMSKLQAANDLKIKSIIEEKDVEISELRAQHAYEMNSISQTSDDTLKIKSDYVARVQFLEEANESKIKQLEEEKDKEILALKLQYEDVIKTKNDYEDRLRVLETSNEINMQAKEKEYEEKMNAIKLEYEENMRTNHIDQMKFVETLNETKIRQMAEEKDKECMQKINAIKAQHDYEIKVLTEANEMKIKSFTEEAAIKVKVKLDEMKTIHDQELRTLKAAKEREDSDAVTRLSQVIIRDYEQKLDEMKATHEQELSALKVVKERGDDEAVHRLSRVLVRDYEQKLDRLKKDHEEELSEVKAARDKARNEADELTIQYHRISKESDERKETHDKEVARLKSLSQVHVHDYEQKLDRLKKDHEEELSELKAASEKARNEAGTLTIQNHRISKEADERKETHDKEVARLKSLYEAELNIIKSKDETNKNKISELEIEIARLKEIEQKNLNITACVKTLKDEKKKEIQIEKDKFESLLSTSRTSLSSEHNKEIERIKSLHHNELTRIEQHYQNEIATYQVELGELKEESENLQNFKLLASESIKAIRESKFESDRLKEDYEKQLSDLKDTQLSEMQRIRTIHQQEKARLEKKIVDVEEQYKAELETCQTELSMMKETYSDAAMSRKLADASAVASRACADQLKKQHQSELSVVKANYDRQISDLEERAKTSDYLFKELQQQNEDKIKVINERCASDVAELKTEMKEVEAHYEDQLAQSRTAAADLERLHAREIATMQSKLAEISELKKLAEEMNIQIKAEHNQRINELEECHKIKIDQTEAQLEKEVTLLKEKEKRNFDFKLLAEESIKASREKIEKINQQHKEQIDLVESSLKASHEELEKVQNDYKLEIEKLNTKHSDEISRSRAHIAVLEDEKMRAVEEMQSKLNDKMVQSSKLQQEVETLQKNIRELQKQQAINEDRMQEAGNEQMEAVKAKMLEIESVRTGHERSVAAIRKEHQEQLDEREREISRMKKNISFLNLEKEKEINLVKSNYEEQLAECQSKMAQLEKDYESDTTKYINDMTLIRNRLESLEKEEGQSKEIEAMQSKHAEELSKSLAAISQLEEAHQTEIERMLLQMKDSLKVDQKRLEDKHKQEVDEERSRLQDKLEEQKKQHDIMITKLKEMYEKRIDKLKSKNDVVIAELKDRFQSEIANYRKELDQAKEKDDVSTFNANLQEIKQEHSQQLKSIKDTNAAIMRKLRLLYEKRIEALTQKQKDELNKNMAKIRKMEECHNTEVARYLKEIEALKEKEDSDTLGSQIINSIKEEHSRQLESVRAKNEATVNMVKDMYEKRFRILKKASDMKLKNFQVQMEKSVDKVSDKEGKEKRGDYQLDRTGSNSFVTIDGMRTIQTELETIDTFTDSKGIAEINAAQATNKRSTVATRNAVEGTAEGNNSISDVKTLQTELQTSKAEKDMLRGLLITISESMETHKGQVQEILRDQNNLHDLITSNGGLVSGTIQQDSDKVVRNIDEMVQLSECIRDRIADMCILRDILFDGEKNKKIQNDPNNNVRKKDPIADELDAIIDGSLDDEKDDRNNNGVDNDRPHYDDDISAMTEHSGGFLSVLLE